MVAGPPPPPLAAMDSSATADTKPSVKPKRGYEKYEGYKKETDMDEWAEGNGPARLYCLVPFVWIAKKKASHAEIMRTWGKRYTYSPFPARLFPRPCTLPPHVLAVRRWAIPYPSCPNVINTLPPWSCIHNQVQTYYIMVR